MVGEESGRMDIFHRHTDRGCPKSPAVCICRTAKVPPKEWDFVQRVTPGVGAAFAPVEEALRVVFLPDLFRGLTEGLPTRENTRLPVKQAGLAIPDPVLTAPGN